MGLNAACVEYPAAKTRWYPRISPKWYHPIFKTSVRYDKSSFKNSFQDEKAFCGCYRRREIFLFIKLVPGNTQKNTSHASFSQLFVHNFSRTLENIWMIINTVASILEQIMSADKHPYTQRPLWEPPISAPYLTPFLAKGPPKMKEGDPLSPLRPISRIEGLSF